MKGRRVSIKANDVLKYIVYFIIMAVLSFSRTNNGLAPFHLGFFVALVYCRESIWALSPMYVISLLIVDFSLESFIIGIVPPLIFITMKTAHYLLGKPLRILHANIYALISSLPVILLNINGIENIINGIATVILSQIFTYCAIVIAYAILIRGIKYRFSVDELVGGFAILGALAMGLFKIEIYGFKLFYLIIPILLMSVLYAGRPLAAILISMTVGIGAGAISGNIMTVGAIVICSGAAMIFIKSNIYFSAIAYLLADIFVGMYFNAYGRYDYLHIIAVAAGLLIFVAVPKKYKEKWFGIFGGGENTATVRSMINRNRREVNQRLVNMSKVFNEMGDVLTEGIEESGNIDTKRLSEEIAVEYCARCPNLQYCASALGGNTSVVLQELVDKAKESGSISMVDAPPFLMSRCNRLTGLIANINSKAISLDRKTENNNQISAGRLLLGEQMKGISELLVSLAEEIRRSVTFDTERERRIIEELSYHNIVCNDIIVCGEEGKLGVTLVVRDKDADKPAILGVVSKLLKNNFLKISAEKAELNGYITLRLIVAPKYSVVYGVGNMVMEGSEASGDTYSIGNIDIGKFMLALCDGMGSGTEAHYNSCTTISMIENFYKAGFNNNAILSLVNKLLSVSNEERFTCLDMCILDMEKGVADFIKLGGVLGLLHRGDDIRIIESGALPLGIVEEATPHIERIILTDGDVIVMFTDGILDSLGIEVIKHLTLSDNNRNPQVLADKILELATKGGAKDDSTVIVARIFLKH